MVGVLVCLRAGVFACWCVVVFACLLVCAFACWCVGVFVCVFVCYARSVYLFNYRKNLT